VTEKLWLMKGASPTAKLLEQFPAPGWKERVSSLREDFDYSVIHGPAAGATTDLDWLAPLCDGVIMVLDAHRTRRAVARNAQQMLQAAHARVLGTILNQRTFPIPEALYQKL
jgi:Mrp family chromosome partitioning ATPase